jgi:DNA-binding MarR family transcriptional regulator
MVGLPVRGRDLVTTQGEDDDVLLAALRLAMGISVHAADQVDDDVSTVQLRALTVLDGEPGSNLGRLAERMGVALSTASRLVERLVSAGLVDRRTSDVNRREVTLRLTEHGARTLSRYDAIRLDGLRRVLERLPTGERDVVLTGLRLLVRANATRFAPASAG